MIGINFTLGTQVVMVVIEEGNLRFMSSDNPGVWTTLEGIQLSREGVIAQFPDLQNDPDWATKAVKRTKNHIKSIKKEDDQARYVIKELGKIGYIARFVQKKGHRPIELKNGVY